MKHPHLTENVHFNQDIDIGTYRQLLNDLDELSYRQLCLIRLIMLGENGEMNSISIDNREQIPQNEQTRFYSIGRDYEYLMDNRYIGGASIPRYSDNDPFVRNPAFASLPDSTERFHQFANLDKIPPEDIEDAFSIWQVRVHKSEE